MKLLKRSMCLLLTAIMLVTVFIGTTVNSSAAPFTIQRQWDSKWKSVYVGGRTMYDTACGIFSIVNAVGYLTGNAPNVYDVAVWANKIGAFNTASFGGTDRSTLYPRIQNKYGATYGFTCDVNGGSGYWAGSSSTKLKNHLANGGVAIGHVPGHFIAIVGYDSSTNKFHVYDSAPSSTRGTSSYGVTGLGDCWVTQSRLATGKLKLDWFCLLSATKKAEVVDKTALSSLITRTEKVSHKNYNTTDLQALRVAFDAAAVVNNKSSATQSEVDKAKNNLLNALLKMTSKTVLSTGKSYTTSDSGRTDGYNDDGIRLTDGAKGYTDGGALKYSGFNKGSASIVVDLGSIQKADTFTTYFCSGLYGIKAPTSIYVNVSVSTDNVNFTQAASSSAALLTNGSGVDGSTWSNYIVVATSDKALDARYVKFDILNYHAESRYIWIDEVEVAGYTASHVTSGIYVTGVNTKIYAGDTKIFTYNYNKGSVAASSDAANLLWTTNVIAKKNSDGSYTVKQLCKADGDASVVYTLAADEIIIASHAWENGASDPIGDSGANYQKLASLQVGDVLYLSGINIDYAFINIGAFISTNPDDGSASVGDTLNNVEQLDGGKTFWLTHYNNDYAEGSGVIFTEPYERGQWWLHIAFEPTSEANVYEISQIVDGTVNGDAKPLAIPSGGFVYALNYGNDYTKINADGSGTDYTSANCTNAIQDVLTWKVGDLLKISGINTLTKAIPTTTKNVEWYNDSYVCTANYVKYLDAPSSDYDTSIYENMLWITHFNDLQAEGAGTIVTKSDVNGSEWNNYYAFAPISGSNAYEIVDLSLGANVGGGKMPTVPAGGFIYAINPGNNYPYLNQNGDTAGKFPDLPDYTSESCARMMVEVQNWKLGDQFIFGNLDLSGKNIPTTTSNIKWYEEGYVCTSTYHSLNAVEDEQPDIETKSVALGDINMDDKVDQYDYILAKRAHFNTVTFTDAQKIIGDVYEDGANDQYDYILIKRIYFNTLTIDKTVEIAIDELV